MSKLQRTPGYERMKGENGEEIGELGPECGSHCGVITVGGSKQHIGHCDCPDCHGDQNWQGLSNSIPKDAVWGKTIKENNGPSPTSS